MSDEKMIEDIIKQRAGDIAKAICANKNIEIRHSKDRAGISIYVSQLKKLKIDRCV